MERSEQVAAAITAFYKRFCAGDPDAFAAGIADVPGVSVIGSAPDEGHEGRDEWVEAFRAGVAESGIRLEGESPEAYCEGTMGWGTDRAAFILPDGGRLPTRLTAVLRLEDGHWKVVHLHFSVGVPDADAIEPAA